MSKIKYLHLAFDNEEFKKIREAKEKSGLIWNNFFLADERLKK